MSEDVVGGVVKVVEPVGSSATSFAGEDLSEMAGREPAEAPFAESGGPDTDR
jgi:hypothetical protein